MNRHADHSPRFILRVENRQIWIFQDQSTAFDMGGNTAVAETNITPAAGILNAQLQLLGRGRVCTSLCVCMGASVFFGEGELFLGYGVSLVARWCQSN